jgi:anti-sigma regulatory factor (Ser/Thr protein kinase)
MQSQEHLYAYHQPLPIDLPAEGWRRTEIHDVTDFYMLIADVEGRMKELSFPRKDSFAVVLALREAVANAMHHGNREDRTRSVVVCHHVSADMAIVEVTDEGLGFDPYLVPDLFENERQPEPTRGRGLFLMRVYMSWIRFNKRGNRILLCKRRSVR